MLIEEEDDDGDESDEWKPSMGRRRRTSSATAGSPKKPASVTRRKSLKASPSRFEGVVVSSPTSTTDTLEDSIYTAASGLSAPGTTSSSTSLKVPEHTFHRTFPAVAQLVWVMFIAGDPDYPVWIGVQS